MLLRRILLYGGALLTVSTLLYYGFIWSPPPSFQVLQGEMLNCLRAKDQRGVDAALHKMRRYYADSVKLPLAEGYLREINRDWAGAQERYRAAIPRCKNKEQKRDILLSVADLSRRRGRIEESERILEEAVAMGGEGERSRELRIHLFLHKGRCDQALSQLAHLAEDYPESARLPMLLALVKKRREGAASQPDRADVSNE